MSFQIDETVQQLQALTIAEGLLGETLRAQVVASMLELYILGVLDVEFTEEGEPIATIIDSATPIVHAPLFVTPSLTTDEEPRQIGFKSQSSLS